MNYRKHRNSEKGAVSLFIVIFATLLITVVTVSFIRIMVKGQQQATATDLSQSAYDSAQAGVEDAKRALLRYQSICKNGLSADCIAAKADIVSTTCNTAIKTLHDNDIVSQSDDEIKIETGGSNSLNQAYTCVKVIMDTVDYLGHLTVDNSKLIPLVGVRAFDSVTIEWFDSNNLVSDDFSVDLPALGDTKTSLLRQNDDGIVDSNSWSPNRPPVLKAQLIQVSSDEFSLSDFDSNDSGNTETLFLYPSQSLGSSLFADDNHKVASNTPTLAKCINNLSAGGYACSVTLSLPPISSGNRVAFLNLSAFYNSTNYRVSLSNGETMVEFNSVQPEIDSTGRASDLFRRVKSRVELGGIFPYPQAEIDIAGNLCKNFFVTTRDIDYKNNCTP